jgi:hypothetical protein
MTWNALRYIAGAALLAATVLLAACTPKGPGGAPLEGVNPGTYRVVLQVPGGDLPFGLELTRAGLIWVAYVVNGPERLKVDGVLVKGSHVEITMPGYDSRLTADATGDGLRGEIVLDKLGGKAQHLPLRANLHEAYRFFPPANTAAESSSAAAGVNVAGRWSVTFSEDDGRTETAVGEFSQSNDAVSGTFLTAGGDRRFLEGQVHGDDLFLSTFDGAHALLYKARLDEGGDLVGDSWSGTAYHERWRAKRNADASLPDAHSLGAVRPES